MVSNIDDVSLIHRSTILFWAESFTTVAAESVAAGWL